MTKKVESNIQAESQGADKSVSVLDPSCGSGANARLPPEQGTTSNVELSIDYLRTSDVVRLSTCVKLKFATGATLREFLWETAWKLVKSHLLGK
jgi:hypothetical protein